MNIINFYLENIILKEYLQSKTIEFNVKIDIESIVWIDATLKKQKSVSIDTDSSKKIEKLNYIHQIQHIM